MLLFDILSGTEPLAIVDYSQRSVKLSSDPKELELDTLCAKISNSSLKYFCFSSTPLPTNFLVSSAMNIFLLSGAIATSALEIWLIFGRIS